MSRFTNAVCFVVEMGRTAAVLVGELIDRNVPNLSRLDLIEDRNALSERVGYLNEYVKELEERVYNLRPLLYKDEAQAIDIAAGIVSASPSGSLATPAALRSLLDRSDVTSFTRAEADEMARSIADGTGETREW